MSKINKAKRCPDCSAPITRREGVTEVEHRESCPFLVNVDADSARDMRAVVANGGHHVVRRPTEAERQELARVVPHLNPDDYLVVVGLEAGNRLGWGMARIVGDL